jgi:hypothetical protein
MSKTKGRIAIVSGGVLCAIIAIGAFAKPAESTAVYQYGMSTQGETCGGTCGANNICCRIVVDPQ